MLKIGLFSDVHYCSEEAMCGTRMCSLSYDKLCKAYEEFEKQKVDLIICLGDLCDVGTISGKDDSINCMIKIVSKMKSSTIPFIFVPGNHDSLAMERTDLEKLVGGTLAPIIYETEQYNFICLDANYSSDMKHFSPKGFDWIDSNLPKEQITFLQNALNESKKECIIAIHENIDSKSHEYFRVNNADRIREIIEKSGKVKLVLQGHKHIFEENTENGIDYISVVGMCEGNENHFMICDYDKNYFKINIYNGNEVKEFCK